MLEQIKNKHILIDGDIVKYRCAASAEKTKYLVEFGPDFHKVDTHNEAEKVLEQCAPEGDGFIWSRKEVQPVEHALQACKTCIDTMVARLDPKDVSIFLSPPRTFRDTLATTQPYKGNRNQPKPKYLKDVENYLIKGYGATVADNIEADDEIGAHLSNEGDGAVSVSIDKDLLQIPGWHYNWVNDRIQRVSPRDGDYFFYTQMLVGDTTDNIPGLEGYGPKKAKEVLSGAKSRADLCTRVWECYLIILGDPSKAAKYFYEQAGLLWILRSRSIAEGQYKLPDGVELS